jgi:hypothetical protein
MRFMVLLLLLVSLPGWSATERSVSVAADGFVEAVPDLLRLELTVKQTAASLDAAQKAVAIVVPKILEIAREHGVADDDIDSSRVSAYPAYQHRNQGRQYVGETMTRKISLTLRQPDNYGSLIQALSKLRLHHINGPTMSHSTIDELKLAALKNALSKGKLKASVIATEMDMQLGKVILIRESGAASPQPRQYRMEAAMMSDGNSEGGFSYGKQRISAHVEMSFELK